MNTVREIAAAAKSCSYELAALPENIRNAALSRIAETLDAHKARIFAANEIDCAEAETAGIAAPVLKRLRFGEQKLADVISGIRGLISLRDPIGKPLSRRQLDTELVLEQVTCPIGVIGVIFESRPDALVQIASLCIKSGNCALLKGGSEAAHTNKALFDLISEAGVSAGMPEGFIALITTRAEISEMLKCHESIDLIIPRGSNDFVRYIMDHSDIPVMGHSDGICHIYVDASADITKAVPLICDSKVQYAAACNAVETVLVHEDAAEKLLPPLGSALREAGVTIRGTKRVAKIIADVEPATDEDFTTEYLDFIVSIKTVADIDEAIAHINRFGSHHTDCIITEDAAAAERFMSRVDSAGVYRNCSTRFADGYRYGLGAEVGISTGKLHARGPVGLDGLQTYKYRLSGSGQIVADYAEGRKSFHFKELL
ncbi:MAG: glutamate-5-semialdehyde dehydrogenase [Clostridiales Family XIII bacterium]|nr:glutamate-5-semialdehyde dehydrogenase [Clostridiales Family XIII bacterium]